MIDTNSQPTKNINNTNFISVKNFGAVGNGLVDDTDAFQTGIETLYKNGGGTLFIPDGVYLLNSVNLRNGVSLIGSSTDATTIKPITDNITVFNDADNEDSHALILTLSMFNIYSDKINITGIKSIAGNRVKVQNINFYGCLINIEFDKGGNHSILNVLSAQSSLNRAGQLKLWSSSDSSYGAVFTTVVNYRTEGDSVDPAIYLRRAVGIRFTNLVMNDNSYDGTGILVENDSQGIQINGCIVGLGTGIKFQKGSGIDRAPICNVLLHLDFDQCKFNSIVFEAGEANSIIGGMITSSFIGTDTAAIYLSENTKSISISATQIMGYYDFPGTAILIAGSKDILISGVIINGCYHGLALEGKTKDITVKDCHAVSNVTYPAVGGATDADLSGLKGYKPIIVPPEYPPCYEKKYKNLLRVPVRVTILGDKIESISFNENRMGYKEGSPFILNPNEEITIHGKGQLSWVWGEVHC